MQPCIKKFNASEEYYFDEGCFITEISNSDNDQELSIARARVQPGISTKLHQLIGTIERYIILTGKGIVEVEGLEAQEVQANDVVIIPPDCSQKITNRSTSDLIFLAVCTPRFKTDCYRDI